MWLYLSASSNNYAVARHCPTNIHIRATRRERHSSRGKQTTGILPGPWQSHYFDLHML